MNKERVVYFDYLRVFAMLAVIVLHISTQGWETADVNSFQWNVLNVYDSLFTIQLWCIFSSHICYKCINSSGH